MREKVRVIFSEKFPNASIGGRPIAIIQSAIAEDYPDPVVARDIAFHLTDWGEDAAFLVALNLAPERFTPDEISKAIQGILIHVPNHVAAAATLGGWPMKDIFNTGASVEPYTEE